MLAQLHTFLIERVNLPDGALGEDDVLIKGDELAERFGRELLRQDRVRWAVALEDPVRHERIVPLLGLDLLRRHAESQRLTLREHVRQQQVVVAPKRRERLTEGNEVRSDERRVGRKR